MQTREFAEAPHPTSLRSVDLSRRRGEVKRAIWTDRVLAAP